MIRWIATSEAPSPSSASWCSSDSLTGSFSLIGRSESSDTTRASGRLPIGASASNDRYFAVVERWVRRTVRDFTPWTFTFGRIDVSGLSIGAGTCRAVSVATAGSTTSRMFGMSGPLR